MIEQGTRYDPLVHSLADGPAGAVLLKREEGVRYPGELRAMLGAPVPAHPDQTSLFEGAPGLAFALAVFGPTRALNALDNHVAVAIRARLNSAHRRIDRGALPAKREYDLMAGLTGFGVYLLRLHGECSLLRDVLAYLVRLAEPHPSGLPGWWVGPGSIGTDSRWSGGHGNLGISHGIAGPVALLAQATLRGIRVVGQDHAIFCMVRWLDMWFHETDVSMWWSEAVSRDEHVAGRPQQQKAPPRPSWCYGTPGIARAQQLAGRALGDAARERLAEGVLASCLADEHQLRHLTAAGLCHGWAGLLHTTWRMSRYAPQLRGYLPMLIDRTVARLHERPQPESGLLTGGAGVRLALHTATTGREPVTCWDACLLLDE